MFAAFLHLTGCSLKNAVRVRLRRLRQPKYLVAALAGVAWLGLTFLQPLLAGFSRGGRGGFTAPPPELTGLFEFLGAWILLVILLLAWLLPARRAALDFTEAEIAFLFPAPVRRRTLLHYKLLRWQLGFLFGALVFSLFTGRLLRPGAWMAVLGGWLVLLVIQLHFTAASFTITRLLDGGLGHARRRLLLAGGVAGALAAAVAWALWRRPPPAWPAGDVEAWRGFLFALAAWVREVSGEGLLGVLLLPCRWLARAVTTWDAASFLGALPGVLALAALHYTWVLRADVAFEEASVEAAQRRLAALERARALAQGVPVGRKRRPGAGLPPPRRGPAWLALTWKNLVAATAGFSRPGLAIALAVGIPLLFVGVQWSERHGGKAVLAMLLVALAALSVLVGPTALRCDLRQSLAAADVLKTLPLRGWQVVLGEVLAPFVLLTAAQAALVLLAVTVTPRLPGGVEATPALRLAAALAGGLALPALGAVGLVLQNAGVLLFPGWLANPSAPRAGLEAMGQSLILLFGQVLAFAVAVAPAALAGGAVFLAVNWLAGPVAALPAAAAGAAAVLYAGCAAAVWGLGRLFDRLDLSKELTGA